MATPYTFLNIIALRISEISEIKGVNKMNKAKFSK
jgi:hypothetical protein